MVGASDRERILVVVPDAVGASDGETEADDWGDSWQNAADEAETEFVRGDDGGPVEKGGSATEKESNDDQESESGDDEAGDGDDPGSDAAPSFDTVLRALKTHLAADVVVRCRTTYTEYVEELGPTLDCVVVLGKDESLVRALVEHTSVPTVIYSPPVVGSVDGVHSGDNNIETLLSRVESAVQENQHVSELRESNARLAALSHCAENITACKTTDAVAERTIEAATDALAFEYGVVFLAECGRLIPRASVLPDPEVSATDIEDGIAGRTLATGESEVVADMQSDPDAVPEHDDLHAVLSVPVGDKGVIQVVSDERDAFDDRDAEFLEILAGYTAEALERIEREGALRRERDRLHAFFNEMPAAAIYVERDRREQSIYVRETNRTYDDRFGTVKAGTTLRSVVPSDSEVEQYEAAIGTGGISTGRVERTTADGSTTTFALRVISVLLPGGHSGAFGIYVDPSDTTVSGAFG
ncbi:MAG: GAF domain-containing protein [Halobellus sp.]|uniref:GAF domain-containing protein n=1 Tax=Halobellus sp. TaxID=1979212 RepID=UPI0035D47F1E